eukprot:2452985-Pyramimonas_sp.AAC.1
MLGEAEFALMKPNVLLCNMARGPVVQRPALEAALKQDRLWGVALDVHWAEPGWDATGDLYLDPRVIATPHIGSCTTDVFECFAEWITDNVRRFRAAEPLVGQM